MSANAGSRSNGCVPCSRPCGMCRHFRDAKRLWENNMGGRSNRRVLCGGPRGVRCRFRNVERLRDGANDLKLCAGATVLLKPHREMSLSGPWEPEPLLNQTAGCVPFACYFSDPETPNFPSEAPWGDATYLGDLLQRSGPPAGVDELHMLTHPRVLQKSRIRKVPRKTRRIPKHTLVLELEGTLAMSSLTAVWDNASTFLTAFQDMCYQVSIKLRPHLPEFLEALAKIYEIFVFTSAKQDYADKMLEVLGPQRKLIRHRLYQEDCLCSSGFFIKDLSVLERDLDKTVAIATCLQAFPYQMSNVVVVPRWQGDPEDQELLHLIPVLETVSQAVDTRVEIETKYRGSGPLVPGWSLPS